MRNPDVSLLLQLVFERQKYIKVGFTGTQRGFVRSQEARLEEILIEIQEIAKEAGCRYPEFHHGDCIGADADAHKIATKLGYLVVLHPPSNGEKRAFCQAAISREPDDYLVRNRIIVEETQLLIACPKHVHEETRSGTWTTVRRARQRRSSYVLIWPNGSTTIP
jgi:hypothetical protein